MNACRKPAERQVLDIILTAPRLKREKLEFPGYQVILRCFTTAWWSITTPRFRRDRYLMFPKYEPHGPKESVGLQAHGKPPSRRYQPEFAIWKRYPLRR